MNRYRTLLKEKYDYENNEIMRDVRARQAALDAEEAQYPTYAAYRAAKDAEYVALGFKIKYATDMPPDPRVREFLDELRASGRKY